jgi:hypothetical protein
MNKMVGAKVRSPAELREFFGSPAGTGIRKVRVKFVRDAVDFLSTSYNKPTDRSVYTEILWSHFLFRRNKWIEKHGSRISDVSSIPWMQRVSLRS